MEEIRNDPEELETGKSRGAERQPLDDATLDPHSYVEQTGNYQQAEAIQNTLTNIGDNAPNPAREISSLPIPLPDPAEQGLSESKSPARDNLGAVPTPLPHEAQDVGATPQPIPRPEDESLIGDQPKVRGDLGQATTGDSGEDKNQATPINLPGPQAAAGISNQAPALGGKGETLPLDGDVRVEHRFTWEAGKDVEKSAGTPERPLREAAHEKPILNQELEDLDAGLDKLGDLEGMIPGPGKLENAPGEESPKQDLLSGMPGLEGFEGGPAGLKNDAEGPAVPGREIPGWESPFPPGKGPNAGMETTEGGKSKDHEPLRDTKLQEYLEDEKAQKQIQDSHDAELRLASPIHTSGQGPSPDGDKILQAARDAYKPQQVDDPEMPSNLKDVEPDMGSKKDPNLPLSQQMEGDRINPKFDAGQVSNYPEDHIKGSQGGGKISEQYAESIKRMTEATAEKNAKVAGTKPKDKAEQITDPPEPQPGKKSESSGKSS